MSLDAVAAVSMTSCFFTAATNAGSWTKTDTMGSVVAASCGGTAEDGACIWAKSADVMMRNMQRCACKPQASARAPGLPPPRPWCAPASWLTGDQQHNRRKWTGSELAEQVAEVL
jgi:hypothetical protein